ncbi:hypothetical protein M5K25_019202 [Dendrobium thyrsiflorum]|uniref:Proteasome activator Blm10 middle HEAT repeats region domain-containing protein n=1 Tax=Dendrobium thyrsiflorum TaxID=117978 RepID=A0ABD0UF13_DENTH
MSSETEGLPRRYSKLEEALEIKSLRRIISAYIKKTGTLAKAIAKSIVFLLKHVSMAREHFERLVYFMEQYYHPSNGGRWTYSFERWLRYLVISSQKRLRQEQFYAKDDQQADLSLGTL